MAKGAWVALLDDDDEWLPQKLQCQVSLIDESKPEENLLVGCGFLARDLNGDAVWPRRFPTMESQSETICTIAALCLTANRP